MRLPTILVAGPVFLDIILAGFDGLPENGREVFIDSVEFSPGGAGITAAVLALLGRPVELVSAVGGDSAGQFVRERLDRYGVGTVAISRRACATPTSIVFPYKGDRFFVTAGNSRSTDLHSIAQSIEQRIRIDPPVSGMHIAFEYLRNEEIKTAVCAARAQGVHISAGIGFAEAEGWDASCWEILRLLDVFFLNNDEAAMVCKTADPEKAMSLLRQYVPMPVMTLGQEGCMLAIPGNAGRNHDVPVRMVHIPSVPVPVLNTCGAGDSFAAAFIASLAAGLTAEESASFSVRVGAATVASVSSIPREDLLLALRDELGTDTSMRSVLP